MSSMGKARYELNAMWKRATGNTRSQRKAREQAEREVRAAARARLNAVKRIGG